ncbi:S26 family signal peptidase [Streptomyces sp. TRM76323]|uniref:S26 family signal peptidase n=1 Tax=Streptomyces tamarix TaxID=3078565 RepID=A0ABU3QHX7_9ACTN|nr:S26 family signal peptidase [Streptomyces tamarix]MDT9682367.1 S26 family signal peptidase [Streptomyces tamarix]
MSEVDRPGAPSSTGQRARAEAAVARARSRALRAQALRIALYAAAALLWVNAVALAAAAGSPVWAAVSGLTALLVSTGLALSRAAELRWVAVSVSGRSMEPTYREGDRVVAWRRSAPVRGAVVIVERPPYRAPWPDAPVARNAPAHVIYARHWFIKRVAAIAGDPVPRAQVPALAEVTEETVPEGMLVLLGDNQDDSYDSRFVGYFPAARVLGSVQTAGRPAPTPPSTARMRNT